jgi:hypothetical protein
MRFLAAAAAVALFLAARGSDGCCMVPVSWNGDVDQAAQEGLVVHAGTHEELVVRVAPFFQTKEKQPLPDVADATPPYVEWVLTVPSPPTSYRTVPKDAYGVVRDLGERLENLARTQYAERSRWEWPTGPILRAREAPITTMAAAAHGLEVGALVRVGPYEITPVKARGREALDALNEYLGGRGFPREDPDHMAWFVDRGFTFLCVHVTPPAGTKTLGRRLDLEPLAVGFETPRPYYPAKFSSRQGPFALALVSLTERPVARASLDAVGGRLRASRAGWDNLWTSKGLPVPLEDLGRGSFPGSVERWHVNRLDSRGFNFDGPDGMPAIASWTDDVFLDLGGDGDEMPGWYYGDRDPGDLELYWRRHRVATGAWAVVGLLVFLGLRRLRRRPRAAA